MKLRHAQTLVSPKKGSHNFQSKVTALCYTRDNVFLAVATCDNLISIFDERGHRVEKFNTKPNSRGPKDYLIRYVNMIFLIVTTWTTFLT